jgi:hypothetical protein
LKIQENPKTRFPEQNQSAAQQGLYFRAKPKNSQKLVQISSSVFLISEILLESEIGFFL